MGKTRARIRLSLLRRERIEVRDLLALNYFQTEMEPAPSRRDNITTR
jgi:hypothetical protein